MKRAALASILFFGAVFAAHADNDVYNDITGCNRGNDLLQVDTTYCDWRLGSPQNGTDQRRLQALHAYARLGVRANAGRARPRGLPRNGSDLRGDALRAQ
jgi:hypothetical protein